MWRGRPRSHRATRPRCKPPRSDRDATPQLIEPAPPTMHPYDRAIPTDGPVLRRASATMHLHPRDIWSQWPRRSVVPARPCIGMARSFVAPARLSVGWGPSSVRIARPLPALTPTFAPVRRDHAPYPRDGALDEPIVRPADATICLHSPVPPSHDRVPRSKGTGHAHQECRWSGRSPGRTGALTELASGWELAIAARASWTPAFVLPLRGQSSALRREGPGTRRNTPGHRREGRAVATEQPAPAAKEGSPPSHRSRRSAASAERCTAPSYHMGPLLAPTDRTSSASRPFHPRATGGGSDRSPAW
jgi:hypothetical protein